MDSWTGGTNMLNRNGFMRRSNGNLAVGAALDTEAILQFFYYKYATFNLYYCLGPVSVFYMTGGGPRTALTGPYGPVGPVPSSFNVSGGVINNSVVFNCDDQPPFYVQPQINNLACFAWPILQWPAANTAGVMRTWRNHVFAGNIKQAGNQNPDMLAWSSSATPTGGIPTEWIATATNDARTIFLSEVSGPIVEMIPLRDQLMVFKESAFWSLSFIGGAFVFSARKVTDSFGINGKNCAADCGGFLVCFCNEDVMWTDGQSFRSIASQKVRDSIVSLTDFTSRKVCFVFYNQATKDCFICLARPGDTTCHIAWVWNADTELWSFVQLVDPGASGASGAIGLTCAAYVPVPISTPTGADKTNAAQMIGAETQALTGLNGMVVIQGNPTWRSGAAVTGTVIRNGITLDAPDAVKYVSRVDLNVINPTSATPVEISIAGRMSESDPVAAPAFVTVTPTTSYQHPCNVIGRFIDIQVRCASVDFECHGFTLVMGDGSVY